MMRHRPDLCVERDGGGRHDRPFRRDRSIAPVSMAASNRTYVQCRTSCAQRSGCGVQRGAPEDVVLGDLDVASSPNAPQHLERG